MLSIRTRKSSPIIGSTDPTIILKNNFYPKGLSKEQIRNHYIKFKSSILNQCKNREIMLFLQLDDKQIVKRKKSDGKFIKLTKDNYDHIIHNRVLSIHGTMRKNEDFGIVDIDSDNFLKSRRTAMNIYDYLTQSSKFKEIKIRYTGKESFHLICCFRNKKQIDKTRLLLKQFLDHKKSKNIDIGYSKKPGKINLDLSPNKYRGGFILNNSLSIIGLKSCEISRNDLINFKREDSIIK